MTEIDSDFLKQLEEAFVIEAREQLQNIMTSVINLEGDGDEKTKSDLAEDILHNLHSMKGNSRAAGVTTAEAVCQMLESALLSLRRKKELLTPEAADVFHGAIDLLDDIINKVEQGKSDYVPETFADILQKLKMLDERQRLLEEAAAAAAAAAAIEAEHQAVKSSEAVKSPDEAPKEQSIINPEQIAIPAPQAAPNSLPAGSAAPAAAIPAQSQSQSATADKSASTRMALWKLDKLLRESEEMLILKQISEQHLEDLRDLKNLAKTLNAETLHLSEMIKSGKYRENLSERELGSLANALKDISSSLDQTLLAKQRRQQTEQRLCFNMVDGFIDSVKSLLMQDFTTLLSVVPKVVRDLSRELKKEVDLEIFGTEIEIDRRILEEIKDPVIHLVRNSLDHGIETGPDRVANGKNARA
ncbi:MAG: Hpt domain-containing protein, partial [Candidatus Obscuribacterales bacterium]|nr:Hpt domain-containing protein [Candidatus Obscuribacterales bacterium]